MLNSSKIMHQHTECPKCGNKQIILYIEEIVGREYSVKTGKMIKDGGQKGVNSWNYKCRCGWYSELYTE